MSAFDGIPDYLSQVLTDHEKELIERYLGEALDLISGITSPTTEKQKRFLRVDSGAEKPASGFELAWLRFKILKRITEDKAEYKKKILELEAVNKSLVNEKNQLVLEAKKLYDRQVKELMTLRERLTYSEQTSRRSDLQNQLSASDLEREIRALNNEQAVLRDYLDTAYQKIRQYETALSIKFTLPEQFTSKPAVNPPVIKYEPMPAPTPSNLPHVCEACFRPVDFCICGN